MVAEGRARHPQPRGKGLAGMELAVGEHPQ
jgi:hypothetical protein